MPKIRHPYNAVIPRSDEEMQLCMDIIAMFRDHDLWPQEKHVAITFAATIIQMLQDRGITI